MILESLRKEKMVENRVSVRKMKKSREKGKQGGSGRWELWVVQLICELLVIGIPPTSIPESVATMYETLYGFPPQQVPSVPSFKSSERLSLQSSLVVPTHISSYSQMLRPVVRLPSSA